MLVTEIRRYMEGAIGRLTPQKAQELARSLLKGEGKDQIGKAAHDLMAWSNKNRERLAELVRTEVRSQLKQIGVASRDEVDALRRRVRALEKERAATTGSRSAAKRSSAEAPSAKASVAKASVRPRAAEAGAAATA